MPHQLSNFLLYTFRVKISCNKITMLCMKMGYLIQRNKLKPAYAQRVKLKSLRKAKLKALSSYIISKSKTANKKMTISKLVIHDKIFHFPCHCPLLIIN